MTIARPPALVAVTTGPRSRGGCAAGPWSERSVQRDGAPPALTDMPAGSTLVVPGGTLLSACVARVRHDPSGSVITLWGARPVRPGRRTVACVAGRVVAGALRPATLLWGADGRTASTHLPAAVSQGDVLVLFTGPAEPAPRRAPAGAEEDLPS